MLGKLCYQNTNEVFLPYKIFTNLKRLFYFSPLFIRMLNDKLMQLEKGFTYPLGVPGRNQLK